MFRSWLNNVLGYLWKALFIVLYPFLALFSLVFTALLRMFSILSKWVHSWLDRQEVSTSASAGPEPIRISLGPSQLELRAYKAIHFGPQLYRLHTAPSELQAYKGQAFSGWHYRSAKYLLLQHWPATEEHLLESYHLVVIPLEEGTPRQVHTFRDFDWQVREGANGLEVFCPSTNERVAGL